MILIGRQAISRKKERRNALRLLEEVSEPLFPAHRARVSVVTLACGQTNRLAQ